MLCTWLPVCCTKPTALQCLQCTDDFIHITADIQRIDGGVLDNSIWVDDEQAAQCNAFTIDENATGLNDEQKATFHSLVAKILYVGKRTRPDVLLTVTFLCTRVMNPTTEDWCKLMRLLKYLNGTKDMKMDIGVIPRSDGSIILDYYVDASYGVHVDSKSQSGAIATLGVGSIYATSSKQKCVSKSSTEAELIAATDLIGEGLKMKSIVEEVFRVEVKLKLLQDNMTTIAIMNNGQVSGKSKHIRIRFSWIKERKEAGDFDIDHKDTMKMRADGFTKPKQGDGFVEFREDVGVKLSEHEDDFKERVGSSVNSTRAEETGDEQEIHRSE